MIRVLTSVDGKLQQAPTPVVPAPATAVPSARALAANAARSAYVADLPARHRETVDSLADPALKRSLERGLRGD